MEWTKEQPTVEGYYWHRHADGTLFMINVWKDERGRFVWHDGIGIKTAKMIRGFWYGPLIPPKFVKPAG